MSGIHGGFLRFTRLSISLILLFVFASCTLKPLRAAVAVKEDRVGFDNEHIRIGSSSALSGHASFLGLQLTQGSLAYFNEVNAAGGIHGRKIEFIRLDDRYEPAPARDNTLKLIHEEKVFALFDYVGTPTAKTVTPVVNDEQTPLLGLFTGAEFLRSPFQPYIFNVRASYFAEAQTIIDHWKKQGKTKVAVFYQNDAFGFAVLDGAELALARHNEKPIAVASYERGAMPEPAAVSAIVNAKPDAVVMVGTYTPLAAFVKLAKEAGLSAADFHTVSFVGTEAFTKELMNYPESIRENVYVTQVVPSPRDSANRMTVRFQAAYARDFPDDALNYVALEGWLNAAILVEAIRRVGPGLSRSAFMQTLESMRDFDSQIGFESVISEQNHAFYETVYISTIKNNQFEIIDAR